MPLACSGTTGTACGSWRHGWGAGVVVPHRETHTCMICGGDNKPNQTRGLFALARLESAAARQLGSGRLPASVWQYPWN